MASCQGTRSSAPNFLRLGMRLQLDLRMRLRSQDASITAAPSVTIRAEGIMTKRFSLLLAFLTSALLGANAVAQSKKPTAAELSKKETVASALLSEVANQEYEVRSAAEAMPADKYGFRPAEGMFKGEHPEYGPAEVRTFGEIVKHVACSNFAFEA